jgi:hypothetical protein
MRGAGGTDGGLMSFFIGLIMMCTGFYMLLSSIVIRSRFGLGSSIFNAGGFNITGGMIMIPFIFGVGFIFYNSKSYIGWILAGGSVASLIFGAIASVNFSFQRMSAFDLIVILILAFGGLGLFLKSLYPSKSSR